MIVHRQTGWWLTEHNIFSSYENVLCFYSSEQWNADLANNGVALHSFQQFVALRLHTELKNSFCYCNTKVTSSVNKWQTEFPPALLVTLSNILPFLSIIPRISSFYQQVGFLANDGKSAKISVSLTGSLISHLQASRWGTRWPTYQAPNKPRHTAALLRMIFLPLEFVCHFE